MHWLRRKVAAMVAAALLLTGSAMLAFPAHASAETKTAQCGGEVTAKPGDRIKATTPLLGLPLDLGVVTKTTDVLTGTINAVLGQVCKVTVKVVDTVVEPVPEVGDSTAKTLQDTTKSLTGTAQDTVDSLGSAVAPQEPQPREPAPQPKSPPQRKSQPEGDGTQRSGGDDKARGIPAPNGSVIGSGVPLSSPFLPGSFGTGYAAMRDYSGIPIAKAGLYAPSPGIRYGNQVPGYQPKFGVLGKDGARGGEPPQDRVSRAGEAEALPGSGDAGTSPASLPVLLAVIALAASTAGLVRTWVLRKA